MCLEVSKYVLLFSWGGSGDDGYYIQVRDIMELTSLVIMTSS